VRVNDIALPVVLDDRPTLFTEEPLIPEMPFLKDLSRLRRFEISGFPDFENVESDQEYDKCKLYAYIAWSRRNLPPHFKLNNVRFGRDRLAHFFCVSPEIAELLLEAGIKPTFQSFLCCLYVFYCYYYMLLCATC